MAAKPKAQDDNGAQTPGPETPPEVAPEQPNQGRKLDETVKGGYYIVNGVAVDANGQPIKEG